MANRFKRNRKKDIEGYAFVGPLLVCLGISMYYGRPDVGALTGVGFGFLCAMIVALKS